MVLTNHKHNRKFFGCKKLWFSWNACQNKGLPSGSHIRKFNTIINNMTYCQFYTHSYISTLRYYLLTSSFQVGHVSKSTIACINTGRINTALLLLALQLMPYQQFLSMVLTNYIHNRTFVYTKKFNSAETCATVEDHHQASILGIQNAVLTTWPNVTFISTVTTSTLTGLKTIIFHNTTRLNYQLLKSSNWAYLYDPLQLPP